MGFSVKDYIDQKNKTQNNGAGVQVGAGSSDLSTPATNVSGGFSVKDYTRNLKTTTTSQASAVDDNQIKGFNTWVDSINSFTDTFTKDYTAREGKYQSATDFVSYQEQINSQADSLIRQAYEAEKYFEQYGADVDTAYGAGTSKQILESLASGKETLKSVKSGVQDEYNYWSQFKDEADYTAALNYEPMTAEQLETLKQELADLQAQAKTAENNQSLAIGQSTANAWNWVTGKKDETAEGGSANIASTTQELAALREKISAKSAEIAQANVDLMAQKTAEIVGQSDFSTYLKKGKQATDYADLDSFIALPGNAPYHTMTTAERNAYYYLLGKEGYTSARAYLTELEEIVNARVGQDVAENINTGVGKVAYGLYAGLDSWASGIKQLVTNEEQATSETQYGSAYIREGMGKVGQVLYDASVTVGNMLPMMAVSALTSGAAAGTAVANTASSVAGGITIGASAAGNAYKQALSEGYDKTQARVYSTLVGAAEAGLQAVLGGVGKSIGVEKLLAKTALIDNALARFAVSMASNIGGEILEEELQLFIEPALRTVIFDESYNLPELDEIVNTAIVTALSTGLMEAPGTFISNVNLTRTGAQLKAGGTQANRLLAQALDTSAFDEDTETHKIAVELEAKLNKASELSDYDVGRLYQQMVTDNVLEAMVSAAPDRDQLKDTAEMRALINQANSDNADDAAAAVTQLQHKDESVADTVATQLMESGVKAADAVQAAKLIQQIKYADNLSGNQIQKISQQLNLKNDAVRTAFSEALGVEVSAEDVSTAANQRQIIKSAREVAQQKAVQAQQDRAWAEKTIVNLLNDQQETAEAEAETPAMETPVVETPAAETSVIRFTDGSKLTQAEYVKWYMAKNAREGVTEAEAINSFKELADHSAKVGAFQGSASTYTADGQAQSRGKKVIRPATETRRNSVSEVKNVEQNTEQNTEQTAKVELSKEVELTLRGLQNLAKKFGVEVVIEEFEDNSNGFYKPETKTIHLSSKRATSQYLVTRFFTHELTHHAKYYDTELVSEIIATMKAMYGETYFGQDFESTKGTYERFYQENKSSLEKAAEAVGQTVEEFINEEQAADFLMKAIANRSVLDKLMGKKPSIGERILDKLSQFRKDAGNEVGVREIDKLAKRLRAAITTAKDKSGKDKTTHLRHSISSMTAAAGLDAKRDPATGKVSFELNGQAISEVSAEHIKANSGLGMLITTAKVLGNITAEEADIQYQAAADIMNMIINTQDPDLVWAWTGSALFSAVKSNSDGQYGTTIDFTTICRKTQNMITGMSRAMMQLGRGLTKDEVTQLQKELIAEGSDVPCPVCYVFSRWAGIGGILENIDKWQKRYENYTPEQIQARIDLLTEKIGGKKVAIEELLKAEDTEFDELDSKKERLDKENKSLTAARRKAVKDEDTARVAEIDLRKREIKDEKSKITARMAELRKSVAPELAWLTQVRANPNFAAEGAVPTNVLYNLDDAATFADKYPLAWKYRTSRGPSAGKAILPYSDMRLGDLILGVKNGTAAGNDIFKDAKGTVTPAQRDAILKAVQRTAAQNLIGGQRFQSTSDFRYDYALDYLLAFWECQAIGSNIQTYTKIIEFADMIATVGGDVNLSVMPRNKGFEELDDGTKRLIFSSVTGVDFEAAKMASEKHDNAQLILVGINDEHIKLALDDSKETGGYYIGFVIPYHASGASINEFIRALVSNLGETFMLQYYQDYSAVQTDKVKSTATTDQARRRDLRSKLLMGREKGSVWKPTEDDIAFINRESVDILGRSFEDLRAVELKALAGDKNAIAEYESWTAGALKDLHNKLWVDATGQYYGVRLNANQAESIMPHEYWNKATTRENAYINGFLFRSYCYNLGLTPRFSGATVKGKRFGDFTSERGYWKTLIDRPMYNNDGTYRDQQKINVTAFQTEMLTPEHGQKTWGDFVVPEPDPDKAKRAADRFVEGKRHSVSDDNPTNDPDIRYSIDPDTGYEAGSVQDRVLKILKAGDLDSALKELEQWATDITSGKIQAMPEEADLRDAYMTRRPATPEEAAKNRATLDQWIQQYGAIEAGEKATRQVQFPQKNTAGEAVGKFVRTTAEAQATPDWFVEELERCVADNMAGFSHEIATNKKAMAYVDRQKRYGFEANLGKWRELVDSGNGTGRFNTISKNDIALGQFLYTEAVKAGDVAEATRLVAELTAIETQAGQVVQAASLLKRIGPSGQLYYLQKAVDRLNRDFGRGIDRGKMSEITIDLDLAKAVLDAKTKADLDTAMDNLMQDIADQVPVTFAAKLNAWRYLAMLGNLRTHVRNLMSNVVMTPVRFAKDLFGAGYEALAEKAGLIATDQRTKSAKQLLSRNEFTRFAKADFDKVVDTYFTEAKHNPKNEILDRRKIFKNKALEWGRTKNSAALDYGDAIFSKLTYVSALSQYLAIRNADLATLEASAEGRQLLSEARAYAAHEAKKATFRDESALATALSRLENSGVAAQVLVGGLMPFKKTPINILKRGAEYSPLGLVKSVTYDLYQAAQYQKTGGEQGTSITDVLNNLAMGTTGTAIAVIGYFLARAGALRGSGAEDENERELEELQGKQDYSLEIFGVSITLDWMSPAALPLFIGCELYNIIDGGTTLSLADTLNAVTTLFNPMFQMSVLDGLNNALNSVKYDESDNPLVPITSSIATSYLGSYVPTLLGQIARIIDPTRRTTYIDKNKDTVTELDRFVQKTMAKIPGASYALTEYVDEWGRTDTAGNAVLNALENLLSPSYVNAIETSAMEEELERLYQVVGDSGVLPKTAAKYFNVDKTRYDLSSDEWVEYQTIKGQMSYELLTDLVYSSAYADLSDTLKATAVEKIYEYANQKARAAAVPAYDGTPSWIAVADELAKRGISIDEYAVYYALTNATDATGKDNTSAMVDLLGMSWLSDTDKATLISATYSKLVTDGNKLADGYRTGYEFTLSAAQLEQYESQFDANWQTEYAKLIASAKYKRADIEERADMLTDLRTEVAQDTRKWMTRRLRKAGVTSTRTSN